MTATALRAAFYTKLSAGVPGVSVYWPHAPQPDDAGSDVPFPFIAIPNVNVTPFNAKDMIGSNAVVQVDIYARAGGALSEEEEVDALFDLVRAAIERQPLTITGGHWVTTEFESAGYGWEDDGKTRRIISLWRVLYHQLPIIPPHEGD